MTVKEFKERLEKYPEDLLVILDTGYGSSPGIIIEDTNRHLTLKLGNEQVG